MLIPVHLRAVVNVKPLRRDIHGAHKLDLFCLLIV